MWNFSLQKSFGANWLTEAAYVGSQSRRLSKRYNLDAPKGVRGRNSDNSKIRELLGWEPSVPLRDGLEQTYCWVYDQVAALERGQVAELAPGARAS